MRSRVEAARLLVRSEQAGPASEDLASASRLAETLSLVGVNQFTLASQIFTAALDQLRAKAVTANPSVKILGLPFAEEPLRRGLESSLRQLAHFAPPGAERVRLVDQANAVRPRTLL